MEADMPGGLGTSRGTFVKIGRWPFPNDLCFSSMGQEELKIEKATNWLTRLSGFR
jgi:hypothetical protein